MSFYQQFTSFFKRKILRKSRDRWNYQYNNGSWNNLHQEEDRFKAVIDLLMAAGKPLDILEIGCGEAVLFRKLPKGIFSSFTGMDISDVAIAAARAFEGEGIVFTTGDMNTVQPTGAYDRIIFNESLYYAKDPLQVLKRFEKVLRPEGCFIVTAVQNKYTAPMWPNIQGAYQTRERREVTVGNLVWDVRLLMP